MTSRLLGVLVVHNDDALVCILLMLLKDVFMIQIDLNRNTPSSDTVDFNNSFDLVVEDVYMVKTLVKDNQARF